MANDTDLLQSDLRELLALAGMSDYARPQSPHEVFQDALSRLRARLGPPFEPPPRISRREKAQAIAEAAANRWDAFNDTSGIGWLVESILALKTEDDERVIAWANRSVREVQDSSLAEIDSLTRPHLADEWTEEDGNVLWWRLPVESPPWCGTPLDEDWTGRHTHWTRLPEVREP